MESSSMGIIGYFSYISVIESVLRMLMYISIICVAYRGVQALHVFINKNSR